jgi:hypothetical protein
MKAYKSLVKYAIDKMGFFVSVFDTEDWAVIRSKKKSEIHEAIESVDECELRFSNSEGHVVGAAYITLMVDDCETVANYANPKNGEKWLDVWFEGMRNSQ